MGKIAKFTNAYLETFVKEHGLELRKDYTDIFVDSKTIIEAKCILCENNMIGKGFYSLDKNKNFGCKTCANIIKQERTSNTNIEVYGHKTSLYGPEVRKKTIATFIKKYGEDNPMKNEKVKEKLKGVIMEKYNVTVISKNDKVKKKTAETNMKVYGHICSLQNDKVIEKTIATNQKVYNCRYPSSHPSIRQKVIDTSIKNYGVPHHMQHAKIAEKVLKNAYRFKNFVFPSGRIDKVQGYEPFGLNDLLTIENVPENDIITKRTKVPEIWYKDSDDKDHRYYVDIYILNQERCVEVKSTWTTKLNPDIILLKQKAVQDAGYQCDVWVYNQKGEKVDCY